MKKNPIILIIILVFVAPFRLPAQILKKIKDKVKTKMEQVVTPKNNPFESKGTEKPSSSGKDTGNTKGNNQSPKEQSVTVEASDHTSYKSKFDFVPGEKILIVEDFSNDAIGDFPVKWNTNGSGEIVTIEGLEGKWLMMKENSSFSLMDLLALPDNFTIQFDLLCSIPFSWSSNSVYFGIADITNQETYLNTSSHTLNNNNNKAFWIDMRPTDTQKKAKGYGHYMFYNTADTKPINANLEILWFADTREGQLLKVSVWKQQQRLRIYLNEHKIIDLPRILPETMKVNTLVWKTGAYTKEDRYFLSNLRVAVGNTDTRNKLLTEGKLVTTGILFNVNSDKIKPESYGVLKEIANLLNENENIRINITGHTDSDGDAAKNLELSVKRAASVKKVLINDFGINSERLNTDGKGESEPVVPNSSPENKATNRRVEFTKIS